MWQGIRSALGLVTAVAVLALPASADADWPVYGKDLANSRDGGAGGPWVGQAAALAEAWRFSSQDGDFTGTPVVADGTVVVGAYHGTVSALDAQTGALRWSRDLYAGENGERTPTINGSAAAS